MPIRSLWGEPHDWIQEQIDEIEVIREQVKQETGQDRQLRYGMRAQVLIRDTEEEAWASAWEIISKVPPEAIEKAKAALLRQMPQTNADRMNSVNVRETAVRGRAQLVDRLVRCSFRRAILIVGTAEQVAERLMEPWISA